MSPASPRSAAPTAAYDDARVLSLREHAADRSRRIAAARAELQTARALLATVR